MAEIFKKSKRTEIYDLDFISKRFWNRVTRSGADDCWNWNEKSGDGYGNFYMLGKLRTATRSVWYLTYGVFPDDGILVCHKCDNPACVNPSHLFLGTHKDNMVDSKNKGRRPKGDKVPSSRLKETDIIEILKLKKAGVLNSTLAKKFSVNKSTITHIFGGRTWRFITTDCSINPDCADYAK